MKNSLHLIAIVLCFIFSLNTQAGIMLDKIVDKMLDTTGVGNLGAKIIFDKKVNKYYQKALQCSPLEVDSITNQNVTSWMELMPEMPDYKNLEKLLKTAQKAKKYAEKKVETDKIRHCYAGCFIRKNLDLDSTKMAAWLKELSDASDCNPDTHFEISDFYATLAGGIAGKKLKCDDFCGRSEFSNLNGEELFQEASRKK